MNDSTRMKADIDRDREFSVDASMWLKEIIFDDTNASGAEYYPFSINRIRHTVRQSPVEPLPETQVRTALTKACEYASYRLNNRACGNGSRHPVDRSVGCVYLPASKTPTNDVFAGNTARIDGNHIHGWVRSIGGGDGDDFLTVYTMLYQKYVYVSVPPTVAWFVKKSCEYLGTSNFWLPVRREAAGRNVSKTEMSMSWGNLDYLSRDRGIEKRHWDKLTFAPGYLFPKIINRRPRGRNRGEEERTAAFFAPLFEEVQ